MKFLENRGGFQESRQSNVIDFNSNPKHQIIDLKQTQKTHLP